MIPVVCENYNRLFDSKSRFESGTIRITILPPIPTAHLTAADATTLTNQVRDAMLAELKRMDDLRQQADVSGKIDDADARMGGVAGFFARFVGAGKSFSSVNRKVDRKEKELRAKGTSGEKPEDYNLVSEGQKKGN